MATNTLSSASYSSCSGNYCKITVAGTVTGVTGLPSGWVLGSTGHIYWDSSPTGGGNECGPIGIFVDEGSSTNYHYSPTETGPPFYTPGATYYVWTKAWIFDDNGNPQTTLKSNVRTVTSGG